MNSPRSSADTRLILIGAAVLLSLGMGIRQSFGLFLTPVTRDLALTAADFTLAVAVQNIIWGLSQAPVGAIAMLPAGFWAGGADRLPGGAGPRTTMRAVLGGAARNRPFLVMSGAYFVCGLNLVFLATHLPTYLAICGQDPMLSP